MIDLPGYKERPVNPYLILAAVVFLLGATVFFFLNEKKRVQTAKKTNSAAPRLKIPCPLCHSRLIEGEKLRSVSFDAGREKIMHIYGCPFCEKGAPGIRRVCPVCKRDIPADGFAVGRMWERKGKLHLHITGCTVCKPQYKNT